MPALHPEVKELKPLPLGKVGNTIERLYRQALVVLVREIKHLNKLSLDEGKLTGSQSKDLRDYVTLLSTMKRAHEQAAKDRAAKRKERMDKVTTEQIEAEIARRTTAQGS